MPFVFLSPPSFLRSVPFCCSGTLVRPSNRKGFQGDPNRKGSRAGFLPKTRTVRTESSARIGACDFDQEKGVF
eukprot:scaffold676_cov316-Pavlova_lutheri.AAC.28